MQDHYSEAQVQADGHLAPELSAVLEDGLQGLGFSRPKLAESQPRSIGVP